MTIFATDFNFYHFCVINFENISFVLDKVYSLVVECWVWRNDLEDFIFASERNL